MNLKTLHKISYGLYIVASRNNGELNGQIANTVFQVTADPPTIAVSINKQNLTHEFIRKSGVFSVSILTRDTPLKFIGIFGFRTGKEIKKFENVKYKLGVTGAPIVLENTVGYVEAKVVSSVDVGTHTIFIGRVVDAEILNDAEPMTYAYYHEVKQGKTPEKAATYIKEPGK
ncbi:MAG: flavin reductase family protein [Candidatus Jordarchaeales archaeon]|nr:flavin reductase [Candidatus Jordarchaeia archaeon]